MDWILHLICDHFDFCNGLDSKHFDMVYPEHFCFTHGLVYPRLFCVLMAWFILAFSVLRMVWFIHAFALASPPLSSPFTRIFLLPPHLCSATSVRARATNRTRA